MAMARCFTGFHEISRDFARFYEISRDFTGFYRIYIRSGTLLKSWLKSGEGISPRNRVIIVQVASFIKVHLMGLKQQETFKRFNSIKVNKTTIVHMNV
uniref:Uncharacterized protein n=1 Tax=Strigamia maritima TaxID=126957 RepID=T1JJB2_STRMM